jgi:catechol 1,2-dioxygenase
MATTSSAPQTPRLNELFYDLLDVLKEFIQRKNLSYDEYHRAVRFLVEAGERGEIPLLLDVFLEVTVDNVNHAGKVGTESCVQGPYYVEGAPMLKPPYVLPKRANEPGEPVVFSGAIRSTEGEPIGGAILDLWQANGAGHYSHFDYHEPRYNLRGKLESDREGRFEVETVLPAPYRIPTDGPTGALLRALGRDTFRPAHFHLKITHDGFEPLLTQVFLAGDRWIDSDCVGAVKESLITTFGQVGKGDQRRYTGAYNFVLRRRAEHRAT